MLWQAAAYAALGLAAALAGCRLFPLRLPLTALLLATGPVAGLLGGLVMYVILDGAHPAASLAAALLTATALLSLLAGPPKRGRHAKIRPSGA